MLDEPDGIDVTRRETGPTRREAPPTRREQPPLQPDGAGTLLRLPATLAARFRIVAELAHQGAEADVLRVRDRAGTDYVVKLYRRGFTVDPVVAGRLRGLGRRHVVMVHEVGESDGRAFEVLEYVPEGNLEALFVGAGRAATTAQVTDVVAQIADGLEQLHAIGIVHRDLKPANVLVRSRSPLELALTDFGLSRSLGAEVSAAYLTTSRTTSYAAPEAFSGHTSAARDWWSLGIIVRDLATGRRLFDNTMDERVMMHHITTRPIDLDAVEDPRIKLLCRGLLTRDPEDRWGSTQVRSWLAGDSPAVADGRRGAERAGGVASIRFNRMSYTDRKSLARALVNDWETAARRFFAFMGTPDRPGEGWGALRDWLLQFDDPEAEEFEARVDLTDTYLTGPLPPDHKLLLLLRWLDPDLAPHYLGEQVRPEDLPDLAGRAAAAGPEARIPGRVLDALLDDGSGPELVSLLASFRGGEGLEEVARRWRTHQQRWASVPDWAGDLPREALSRVTAAPVGPYLVALAAAPDEAARNLMAEARAVAARVAPTPNWFRDLLRRVGDDPIGQLVVVTTAGQAIVQAGQLEEGRRAWAADEAQRLAGRTTALLWAVGGSSLLVIEWLVYIQIGLGGATRNGRAAAGAFGFLLLLAELAAEAALAWHLAGAYHPTYSLAGQALRLAGPLRRTFGAGLRASLRPFETRPLLGIGVAGCLVFLVIPVLLAVIGAYTSFWTFIFVTLAVAHWLWTWRRYRRWLSVHAGHRTEIERTT